MDQLITATSGRPVDALLANAGRGLGHAFLDQSWNDIRKVLDTNVTGTLYLIHDIGAQMRERNQGRILITGSIAGFMPGTYQAAYDGTKALLDSFAFALCAEMKDTAVSVTCLMPGATETEFFERADMLDTEVGSGKKQSAEEVAQIGFDAMMKGESDVVAGWQNKLRAAIATSLRQACSPSSTERWPNPRAHGRADGWDREGFAGAARGRAVPRAARSSAEHEPHVWRRFFWRSRTVGHRLRQ